MISFFFVSIGSLRVLGKSKGDAKKFRTLKDLELARENFVELSFFVVVEVQVDWTPELHRRFVQAVEQLGVDKAVPSRILELMGIECLTRHNVASHLQVYFHSL